MQKDIMQWLQKQPDISKIPQQQLHQRYQGAFGNNALTFSSFGRFLATQHIGRYTISYNGKIAKAYNIARNSTLEYIPHMQKTLCHHCNGRGYTRIVR